MSGWNQGAAYSEGRCPAGEHEELGVGKKIVHNSAHLVGSYAVHPDLGETVPEPPSGFSVRLLPPTASVRPMQKSRAQ